MVVICLVMGSCLLAVLFTIVCLLLLAVLFTIVCLLLAILRVPRACSGVVLHPRQGGATTALKALSPLRCVGPWPQRVPSVQILFRLSWATLIHEGLLAFVIKAIRTAGASSSSRAIRCLLVASVEFRMVIDSRVSVIVIVPLLVSFSVCVSLWLVWPVCFVSFDVQLIMQFVLLVLKPFFKPLRIILIVVI